MRGEWRSLKRKKDTSSFIRKPVIPMRLGNKANGREERRKKGSLSGGVLTEGLLPKKLCRPENGFQTIPGDKKEDVTFL